MRRLLVLLLVLTGSSALFAKVDLDYAVFKYDSTLVDWELYYTIPRQRLNYLTNSDGLSATIVLELKLTKDGVFWKQLTWKIQDKIPGNNPDKKNMLIVDRVKILAPPGAYTATFYIKDPANAAQSDSMEFSAVLAPIPMKQLALSDIEFAGSIEKNSQDIHNPFYKNSLLVVPNPSRVFGKERGQLNFYIETYHLLTNLPGDAYIVRYSVTDANGKLKARKASARKKKVDDGVEFGTVAVDTLDTGAYSFKFSLADTSGKEQICKQEKFYIYNKDRMALASTGESEVVSTALKTELGVLDEKSLDAEFRFALYLSTPDEREMFKTMKDMEAKRNFIQSFWQSKNRVGNSSKFRKEYLERVKYCNTKFATFRKEGWQTDRGRVYIQYGPPSYINQNPSTEGLWPYETWDYNEIQGGAIFVFADFSGFKDFQLLHSDVIGEMSYPNYMDRIRRGF